MKLLFGLLLAVLSFFAIVAARRPAPCLLPHSANGDNSCRGFFPSWSYDKAHNKCVRFNYGGCEGNDNRFDTQKECEDLCKK